MNRSVDLRFSFFSKLFPVSVQNYYILEFPFFKIYIVFPSDFSRRENIIKLCQDSFSKIYAI